MNKPTLLFFRNSPSSEELITSIQSFESSLLLIALKRYSHALLTCSTAIESALKATFLEYKTNGLKDLLTLAREKSKAIACLSADKLTVFRQIRNKITHQGFDLQDDNLAVRLYLEVGLPLLEQVYQDFYSFPLSNGILPEYAGLIERGKEIFKIVINEQKTDFSYCFLPLEHLINWSFKQHFLTSWELEAINDMNGGNFEQQAKLKQQLEGLFSADWIFDCPICNDIDSVVCELDPTELVKSHIVLLRMVCVVCGFIVRKEQSLVSQVLLANQVTIARSTILREYGLK